MSPRTTIVRSPECTTELRDSSLELHPRSTVISFTFARNARTHLDPHAYLDIFGGDVRRKLQRWRDYREPKVRVNSGKGVLRGDRDHTRAEILDIRARSIGES